MFELKQLREKKGQAFQNMQSLLDKAKEENRALTTDEQKQWDQWDNEFENCNRQIQMLQKQQERAAEFMKSKERQKEEGKKEMTDAQKQEARDQAFFNYLRFGMAELSPEERQLLGSFKRFEQRAQSTANAAGGYTIPEGFSNEIERFMIFYGGMMEAARMFETDSGNPIPWPTNDDTTNKGRIVTEATGDASSGGNDLVFGQKVLNAYTYTSDLIKVSNELLQDSAFDMQPYLAETFAERIGKILNLHLTTGDGSDKPNGAVTASGEGNTAAGAAAITSTDVLNLIHSVDRIYRNRPQTFLMMNDSTLKAIKFLAVGDTDDRPLWVPSIRDGEPDLIWGQRYIVNNDMPDIGSGAKSILYGDFSKYIIRHVRNSRVFRRAEERYIENNVTAFVSFDRYDGELLNNKALKHLRHPAS